MKYIMNCVLASISPKNLLKVCMLFAPRDLRKLSKQFAYIL